MPVSAGRSQAGGSSASRCAAIMPTIARNRARSTATILVSERLSSCRVDEREEEDFSAATPFAPRVAPAPSRGTG
ncbi:hypothetical protein C5C31_08415 [Rathayibacter rathayi]|nr:hypothetical protein C5C31_08415 [Rathayibacter rathayi]